MILPLIVEQQMQLSPLTGSVILFCNKGRNYCIGIERGLLYGKNALKKTGSSGQPNSAINHLINRATITLVV
ncbi:MAG TPA: hypothetical protein DE042_01730 [Colwellia sp.]|nr:hypothetical protein [Colwellia sp.]